MGRKGRVRRPPVPASNLSAIKNHLTRERISALLFPVDRNRNPKPNQMNFKLSTGSLATFKRLVLITRDGGAFAEEIGMDVGELETH